MKTLYGLLVSIINLICGFLYFYYVHKLIMTSKNEFWEWDKKSLTAADYSIEMYVEEMYKEFMKERQDSFGTLIG